MVPQGAILIALQTCEQNIDQIVLQPEILVGNKSNDVQIAVLSLSPGHLENFGFNDAGSIVADPFMVQIADL